MNHLIEKNFDNAVTSLSIDFEVGYVRINGYDRMINEAKVIANYLDSIEVTEESLKEAKKLLSKVRKAVNELKDFRLEVKRDYLRPFSLMEERIKEIENLVKQSDEKLREQTRAFDEKAREKKKEQLQEIWNKRANRSQYNSILDFDRFLEPRHLNKSVTIKSVETEMADYIANRESDYDYVLKVCEEKDYPITQGINLFEETGSLSRFLTSIEEIKSKEEEIKESLDIEEETEEPDYIYFRVPFSNSDTTRKLLEDYRIPYEEYVF